MEQLSRLERRGGLMVLRNTRVTAAAWSVDGGAAPVGRRAEAAEATALFNAPSGVAHSWLVQLRDTSTDGSECAERADAIWVATGSRLDAASLAPLRTARALSPRPEYDGLPELTPTLRWDARMPLYVAGGLSALQIGPDAFNLGGAGASAARIVSDVLQPPPERAAGGRPSPSNMRAIAQAP